MENMQYWNVLKAPPREALRPITGGRLRGKTDISPQWRYKAMTELFGVCGVGWKYAVNKLWLEPAGDEICAFAEVSLSILHDGKWSDPIPGVGGSMLRAKEDRGLHVSDEAYKMAITDALSVAMKMLGVAADVYAGLFDGKNYSEDTAAPKKAEPRAPAPAPAPAPTGKAPPLKTLGELYARASKFGLSPRDVLGAVEVGKGENIIDFDEAWKAAATKFAADIKARLAKATGSKEGDNGNQGQS